MYQLKNVFHPICFLNILKLNFPTSDWFYADGHILLAEHCYSLSYLISCVQNFKKH